MATLKRLPTGRTTSPLRRVPHFLHEHRGVAWNVVPVVLAVALVLIAWEIYVQISDTRPTVLPPPSRVFSKGWEFRDLIWSNTKPTLLETAIGFSISVAFATVLATLMDFSSVMRRSIYPVIVASQTIPLIVLAPLMIIWFGFGILPKIILVALITFFPITIGWLGGFNSSDREESNLLKAMGANRWQIFLKVRVPSALPLFFVGFRISITFAVIGAVFAEYAGAREGLGIFMLQQTSAFRTDLVIAAVFVVMSVSILLFLSTYIVERLAIPWYFATRRANET